MKEYPSIPSAVGQSFIEIPNAYIFDKLDGRNIRAEWSRKAGWSKFGSRHQLLDQTGTEFATVTRLFNDIYNEPLTKLAWDRRWERLTVYLELWQAHSLGGIWVPDETFRLTLFDVEPYKRCMMGPKDFLNEVATIVPTAAFLGQMNWTRTAVDLVRHSAVAGITFEGVVAKAGERHKLVRAKAKTQDWIDAILARYGEVEGKRLVES